MKQKAVIYIHGKNGSVDEADHYRQFFTDSEVIGFDYFADNPWDAQIEFQSFFNQMVVKYPSVIIIANSIGAYFSLVSLSDYHLERAFFVSPIVDMEALIQSMMLWAQVSESDLKEKKIIETAFGETLSWDYLTWVRQHPIQWNVPTFVLYGSDDHLQSINSVRKFIIHTSARLTIMDNGEHWFHTDEQMAFLDSWIQKMQAE